MAPFVVGGSAPAAPPAGSPASSTTPSSPAPPAPPGPPQQGDLAQVSPIRLYFLAASSNQTGLLSLKLPDRTIEIHFRKGNPEYVGSDHADDAVAGFLVREGLATNAQISQATAELPKFGGDLVAALFGAGILNPATAFQHLAQRAQQLLLKAVLATTGSFTFSAQELPSHKAMPLGNRWAVLMDLVRRIPASEIKRRLADASNNPVMKSGGVVPVSDLRLTPQETRALGFIDGVRSLIQLARDLPQDADVFFRLAFVLREMDIVSFSAVTVPPPSETPRPAASTAAAPKPSTPPPAAARPSPAAAHRPTAPPPRAPVAGPGARPAVSAPPAAPAQPTAAPEPPPVDVQTELKNLRTAVAKLKDQNKFEILGLTKKADGAAVKVAYFKLAKTYHPDTVPPGAPPELAKLKAEMFAAVGNAYRTLSDDASRAAYLEELESGLGEVDVAKILHAEELFQKGMILVKAKKFPEAVEMLSEAITENPDEGEFYAWRGYARFFTNPDNKAGKAEADRDIQIALKKNPRCAPAHFFSGQMWKLLGDTKQALAEFKKTLELQPDHLDAQREIRYLKK
ncbi:MAG: DnaJ domain-containing protein [Myxococcaceae bacterium]|nr:DnaJ domain-containing protein [Myxococcaceae bacterium]